MPEPPDDPVPVIGKICCACGQDKPIGAFYKNHAAPDGLDYRCKDCAREKSRKYREEHATKRSY